MAQGGKALGIAGIVGLIITILLIFVLFRSCHQGNNPQSTDDVREELEEGLDEPESELDSRLIPAEAPPHPFAFALT